MDIQKRLSPAKKAGNLADAAAALRAAERSYRVALIDGNLIAAILAKETLSNAEITLAAARLAIEGFDE